ncbi:MAG: beta-N-acetylhexosaminidase [Micavibrio aeruginosavorus]|uniref:beta-N-acetylhexosaminidase n=1 Tax=Micavibrio aeruginosavorus TaxID=349221 RepID=A0A2W5MZY9_9BACT|nr:MAG: beta-N-acetylhexosaminidase [Micavibrio aeruginosavorus]
MDPQTKPVILSCITHTLKSEEREFFAGFKPFGFILFARNILDPVQLKKLCKDLRDSVGWHCPILIDQEGGRVRRMRPPHWPDYPSMKEIGDLDDKDRLINTIRGISDDLNGVGIDVDCAPVLDVLFEQTHAAIGDRAFSHDPDIVGALAGLACETFINEGITPVIKHMPGQGRAAKDSHYDLPVVSANLDDLENMDFRPFRHIIKQPYAHKVWGMVSHIIYTAVDAEHPASVSSKMTDLIRNELNFQGLLVSDDLCMNALCTYGSPADRVAKTLEAGLDIALYCAGHRDEMEEIAKACPPLREDSLKRFDASSLRRRTAD